MVFPSRLNDAFKGVSFTSVSHVLAHGEELARRIDSSRELKRNAQASEELERLYSLHLNPDSKILPRDLALYAVHKVYGVSQNRIGKHFDVNPTRITAVIGRCEKAIGGSKVGVHKLGKNLTDAAAYLSLDDAMVKAQEIAEQILKKKSRRLGVPVAASERFDALHALHVNDSMRVSSKMLVLYLLEHAFNVNPSLIAAHFGVTVRGLHKTRSETNAKIDDYLKSKNDDVSRADLAEVAKYDGESFRTPDSVIYTVNAVKDAIFGKDMAVVAANVRKLYEMHRRDSKDVSYLELLLYGAHHLHDLTPKALAKHYGISEPTVRSLIDKTHARLLRNGKK